LRRYSPPSSPCWSLAAQGTSDSLHGISIWAFWDSLRTDVGLGPQDAREAVVGIFTAQLTRAGFSI
jgi:hypothetical protein